MENWFLENIFQIQIQRVYMEIISSISISLLLFPFYFAHCLALCFYRCRFLSRSLFTISEGNIQIFGFSYFDFKHICSWVWHATWYWLILRKKKTISTYFVGKVTLGSSSSSVWWKWWHIHTKWKPSLKKKTNYAQNAENDTKNSSIPWKFEEILFEKF